MVERRDTMDKIKLIVTLVLVLLVGIFAGSLGTRIYLNHQLDGSRAGRSHSAEDRVNKIMKKLTVDLNLNTAQQAEIHKIVTMTEAKATGVRASYEPSLKKVYDRNFELIKEKLNDEQKTRLHARQERFSRRYTSYYFRLLNTAGNGLPDAATLKDRLNLDPAQQSRVASILEDQKNKRALIVGKYEKMDHPDLAAINSELADVEKTTTRRLSEVLTEKQMARYLDEQ